MCVRERERTSTPTAAAAAAHARAEQSRAEQPLSPLDPSLVGSAEGQCCCSAVVSGRKVLSLSMYLSLYPRSSVLGPRSSVLSATVWYGIR